MKHSEFSFDKIPNKKSIGDGIEAGPRKILPDYIDYKERKLWSEEKRDEEIVFLEKKYRLSPGEATTLFGYMYYLNLKTSDIVNKKIIDIGSGSGEFKSALEKFGVAGNSVINFDENYMKNPDVVGDAEALPFKDESFDTAVAHCSVPIMKATSKEYEAIPRVINEMLRVVKKGGVVKIFPIASVNKILEPEFNRDRLRMSSMVLEELDKIHKINKDIKIKILETQFDGIIEDRPGSDWVLEIRK